MSYTIKAKPQSNRVALAQWVRRLRVCNGHMTLPRALQTADDMLQGQTFEWYLFPDEIDLGKFLCDIVEVPYENPYQTHFDEQKEYAKLLEKGAAGDTDAAIAYCKLEMEGKVSHGAFG